MAKPSSSARDRRPGCDSAPQPAVRMQKLLRDGFILRSKRNLDALVARDHANPEIDGRRRQRASIGSAIRVEVHANVLDGTVRHASEEQDFGVRQRLAGRVHDARRVDYACRARLAAELDARQPGEPRRDRSGHGLGRRRRGRARPRRLGLRPPSREPARRRSRRHAALERRGAGLARRSGDADVTRRRRWLPGTRRSRTAKRSADRRCFSRGRARPSRVGRRNPARAGATAPAGVPDTLGSATASARAGGATSGFCVVAALEEPRCVGDIRCRRSAGARNRSGTG